MDVEVNMEGVYLSNFAVDFCAGLFGGKFVIYRLFYNFSL